MASYNGTVIALNQPGVDALNDLADALPGAKEDLHQIGTDLRKAINQYGSGLGVKKEIFEEIVSGYEKIVRGIGDSLDLVSSHMKVTAGKMQDYIDSHNDDSGHGPMEPTTKVLKR